LRLVIVKVTTRKIVVKFFNFKKFFDFIRFFKIIFSFLKI